MCLVFVYCMTILQRTSNIEIFIFISISNDGPPVVAYSESARKMLRITALQTSKMKLYEAIAELKQHYESYREHPVLHPMYAKEWQIFYLRRLSDLLAGLYRSSIA